MRKIFVFCLFLSFFFFLVSCGEGKKVETDQNGDESSEYFDDEFADETFYPDEENVSPSTDEDAMEEDNDDEQLEAVEFNTPDTVEGNLEAVIVTKEEFAEIFSEMAVFHTMTGIFTKVITVENICAEAICDDDDPKNDTAKAIKEKIKTLFGLKYLVIGGDIEVVPSRKVRDKYSNLLAGTFEENFQTDFYFADFSDWDLNNNGIYAESGDKLAYFANIAVGRIPVSTVEEARRYFEKLIAHNTNYNTAHAQSALLLANVATSFSAIDINAGYYFETDGRTRDIIPFHYNIQKLYTKTTPSPAGDALALNNDAMKAALENGVNVVVHNGHGYPTLLSCEQSNNDNDFTGQMAYELTNNTFPFFLSCACQAGQFEAPFTYTTVNDQGEVTYSREFKDDSAGEKLINAPNGGSIFYLGNTTTGLGLAGGSQFIDEMLRNMFLEPSSPIGDSYLFAHAALKKNDTFAPPIPLVPAIPVVDESSWKWTKKSVVALGSPLATFWRDSIPPMNAFIGVRAKEVVDGHSFDLEIPSEFAGFDLRVYSNGSYFTLEAVEPGTQTINIKWAGDTIFFALLKPGYQPFFQIDCLE
ncbi:MAG: C25 family cysteine peptidase [bacterium]